MTLPRLCVYHHGIYTAKWKALKNRFRHPGAGRKALAIEAATVSRQCPRCIQENTP